MSQVFKKKKLLRKGFYKIEETVDPETIIWENLGHKLTSKMKYWLGTLFISALVFSVSFAGFWAMALIEKNRVKYVKSDCLDHLKIDLESAYQDFMMPEQDQKGYFNCFCEKMLDVPGGL